MVDPAEASGYILGHEQSPYPIHSQSIQRPEAFGRSYRCVDPRRRDGPALPTGHLPGRFRHGRPRDGHGEAGIGQTFLAELHRLPYTDPALLSALLEKITEALDQSPAPAHEWRTLQDVLGLELLARLLKISQSSARRYLSGTRATPDTVAARLHFLAFVVGDLAGAYNDIGVRRWFDRRRERLDGKTPAQALGDAWSPEDGAPQRIREVARSLASSPAT